MIRQPPSLNTETEAVMKHLWDSAIDSSASLQKDFAALQSICTKVKRCPYKSLNREADEARGAPHLPVPLTTRRLAEAAPSYLWTVILHCGEADPDEWISELLGCDNSTRNRRRGWQMAQEAFYASWSKFTKSVISSLRPKLLGLHRQREKPMKKPLAPMSDRLIHQQFTTPEELQDMHRRLGQRRQRVYRQMQEDLFCASWESMTRPIVNLAEPVSDHAAQRLRGYIHLLIDMELDNAPYASIKEPWLLSMLRLRLSELSCNLSSELAYDLETQVDEAIAEWQLRCRRELEPPQENSLMEPLPLERGLRPCLLSEKERKDREKHSPYHSPMPFPGPYRIAWNTVGSIADRDRVTDPPSPGESDSGGRSRRSKRMRRFVPEEFVDPCGRLTTSIAALSKDNRKDLAVHLMSQDLTGPIILIENRKGRAVIAYDYIERGSFVCQYKGEFIESPHQAAEMEKHYEKLQLGCYMFYFGNPLTSKMCCIDSTDELLEYGPGRLVNHGRVHCNLQLSSASPKAFADGRTTPVLYFVANRNIYPGEELLIDYGDRDPLVIRANPWLKY
ncbi:MAG: hypothetical protein KVP17_001651 [Porospora cf. gigantea B]|nr:MAG: hypothetical protein KVP17_001651 [Porospora cf. gigantea B]